jgi:hypothetical protein
MGKTRVWKNGEFVKCDRITGSPAAKLLVEVVKVTVVPVLDHPLMETALPAGVGMLALGLRARQLVPFTLKSGE